MALTKISAGAHNVDTLAVGTSDAPVKPLDIQGGGDYNVSMRSASSRSGFVIHPPGTGGHGAPAGSGLVLASDNTFRLGTQTHYNLVCHQDGSVTLPRLPACYGRLQTGGGPNATGITIDLNALYDPRSMVNATTDRITVPVAGLYEIKAAQLVDPTGTYVYLNININGTVAYHAHSNMFHTTGMMNADHRVNINWNLAANDYITFTYSGATQYLWNGNHSFFGVTLIG